jgi:hypothetical protein
VRLKGRKTVEGERGEVHGASLVQDLSGVLSVREVESKSAVQVRGRDLLSKSRGERFGVFRSVLGRERVAGAHQEREWVVEVE